MTPEEYSAAQALLAAKAALLAADTAELFLTPAVPLRMWLRMIRLLYPQLLRLREDSARLGRRFYDSQRQLHHPDLPRRQDHPVERYTVEQLVEAITPSRKRFSLAETPQSAVGDLARRVAREVENGGRRQVIRSAQTESAPGVIRGWARVATGRETCAWCLMLISRGPVYHAADTAGLDLDDKYAARLIAAGRDVSEWMDQWHEGCDCKVVPVFHQQDWPGKAAADAALDLWTAATKDARGLIESGQARTGNLNTEAINALRRKLYRGEVTISDFAAFAA